MRNSTNDPFVHGNFFDTDDDMPDAVTPPVTNYSGNNSFDSQPQTTHYFGGESIFGLQPPPTNYFGLANYGVPRPTTNYSGNNIFGVQPQPITNYSGGFSDSSRHNLGQPKTNYGGGSFGNVGYKREVKAPSEHRRYSTICSSNNHSATLSNHWSLQLTQQALLGGLATSSSGNMAISPVSIDAVLSVLAAGAEGQTLQQLLAFLGFHSLMDVNAAVSIVSEVLSKSNAENNAPDVSFASGLWIDQRYDVKASFAENLRDVHRTEARAVDFKNKADEVVKEANLWVTEQSKGLIKHIFNRSMIKENTIMILANALYFKGDWYETFKPENTELKDFHLLNGDKIRAPCMQQHHTKFDYGTLEGCQILRMMYKEGEVSGNSSEKPKSFSMYVFLPEEKDGLPDMMKKIKMDSSLFKDKVKLEYVKIDKLVFPKFAFDSQFLFREQLEKLGVKLPFDMYCKDFTRIVENLRPGDNFYVDEIAQKCRVETNEEGTTAFAVTYGSFAYGCGPPSQPPPPLNFVADYPFMFVIREDFSGAVLFVGTMLNPLSKQ